MEASGEHWSPGTVDYFLKEYPIGTVSTGRKKHAVHILKENIKKERWSAEQKAETIAATKLLMKGNPDTW